MSTLDKSEMITFSVGCISAAAVVISVVAAIYYGISNSSRQYHTAMQQCIEARGTWVPTTGTGACVINNR